MPRSWKTSILMLVGAAVVATLFFRAGDTALAVAASVLFTALAVSNSPLFYPRSLGNEEARRRSAVDGRPVIYWRPGCQFCLRLRLSLGRDAKRAYWVDIWRDPAAAAVVRAANNGDETVPTVVIDGQAYVNPGPEWLRQRLPAADTRRSTGLPG